MYQDVSPPWKQIIYLQIFIKKKFQQNSKFPAPQEENVEREETL